MSDHNRTIWNPAAANGRVCWSDDEIGCRCGSDLELRKACQQQWVKGWREEQQRLEAWYKQQLVDLLWRIAASYPTPDSDRERTVN